MPAGGGNFQGSFGGLLSTHFAKIDAVVIGGRQKMRRIDSHGRGWIAGPDSGDHLHRASQVTYGIDIYVANNGSLFGIFVR